MTNTPGEKKEKDKAQAAPAASSAPVGGGARPPGFRPRVGDVLLESGDISPEQLEKALREQERTKRMLGEVLVEQGTISGVTLVKALAKVLGVKGCQLRPGLIDPTLVKLVGAEECERLKVVPMFKVRDELTVAMAEPQNLPAIDRLKQITGCRIRPVMALEKVVLEYARKFSQGNVDVDAFLRTLSESDVEVVERETVDEGPVTDLDVQTAGNPVVNLVNVAFLRAVNDRASDIHIEPDKKGTRIRYRINGELRDLMKPPPGLHAPIVARVKVIGKMDIAEKRLPQGGRVRIVAEGREIDLRISSIPTLLGEKVVVRILDKSNLRIKLEELGFRNEPLQAFKRALAQSHGLCLVTGPTGSGKTTTLYSALDLLRSPETNIVTVEDPVEYQLDLVNQIQVQDQVGLTFATALRAILRQDPDVIMVGEIRDEETAKVAVQAALTGHLVLATLHTNDAPGSVARLVDMGVKPYLISASLNAAVAQRLARTICPGCATKYYPSEELLRDAGLTEEIGSNSPKPFRKGVGCQRCFNSGFLGRVGIYEVFEVTSESRRAIHHSKSTQDLRREMRARGMMSLREEGVLLAVEGKTSLEEILRVTKNEEDDLLSEGPARPVMVANQGDATAPEARKEAA